MLKSKDFKSGPVCYVYEDSEVIGKIRRRPSSHRGSTADYLLPKENISDAWHIVKCHCAYSGNGGSSLVCLEGFYF